MHLGVLLAHHGPVVDLVAVRAAARSADVLGYDSLWAVDPPLAPLLADGRPATAGVDALAALAEAGACTERVGLGAHLQARADRDGRRVAARATPGSDRLVLAWDVGAGAGPAVDGAWLGADSLVSGADEEMLVPLAAAAAGWLAVPRSVASVEPTWRAIRTAAERAGRDPSTLSLVVRADIELTGTPLSRHRSTFRGSLDQVVDDLLSVERLGADTVVLAFGGHRDLDDVLGGYAAIAEGLELRAPS